MNIKHVRIADTREHALGFPFTTAHFVEFKRSFVAGDRTLRRALQERIAMIIGHGTEPEGVKRRARVRRVWEIVPA